MPESVDLILYKWILLEHFFTPGILGDLCVTFFAKRTIVVFTFLQCAVVSKILFESCQSE